MDNYCSSHLGKEIVKLRCEFELKEQIGKLNDQVSADRSEQGRHEIQELSDKLNSSLNTPLEWQHRYNIKIDELNILRVDNYEHSPIGFVQSDYCLKPTKPSFKISSHSSGLGELYDILWIGLTPAIQCNTYPFYAATIPSESFVYGNHGQIIADGDRLPVKSKWKWNDNDIIECGIKFPENFVNDGNQSAAVYFCRNEDLIFEKVLAISCDKFFPTISFVGQYTRVRYINN